MKRKYLIITILIILILNTSFVFADRDIRYYYNNIENAKNELNENISQLPNTLQNILKRDKIKIEIKTSADTLEMYVEKIKDGKYNITRDEIDKVNVWIVGSEEKINQILESENPSKKISQAIKNKEVDIKAQGFLRKIKYWFLKLILRFT